MSANNPGLPFAAGAIEYIPGNVQPAAGQPRQPRDLRGLLRFAVEARVAAGNAPAARPPAPQPMDDDRRRFLAEALNSMTVDMAALVRRAINTLTDPQKTAGLTIDDELSAEVKSAFYSLKNVVDDIDIANDFAKMGGFDVFRVCFNVRNQELWALTCDLLAEVCQNNPACQKYARDHGLLPKMVHLLQDPEATHLDKFVYAISCTIRDYEPGCRQFMCVGGLQALVELLTLELVEERAPEGTRLKAKVPFLIRHLCQHYEEAREILMKQDLPVHIVTEIRLNSTDEVATEHMLELLKVYIEKGTPDVLRQCRSPSLNITKVIQELLSMPHMNHPDVNTETLEHCNAILKMLTDGYDQNSMYDCEDEADR